MLKKTTLKSDKRYFKVLKKLRLDVRKSLGVTDSVSNATVLEMLLARGYPRARQETRESVYARFLGRSGDYEAEKKEASRRINEARKAASEASLQKLHRRNDFARKIGSPHPDYANDGKFYETREWRELRYLALRNTDARCECCGATAKDGVKIHVDHIQPRYKRPDLSLSLDNLQVLCEDCNFGKGAWDTTDWRIKM